MIKQFQNFIRKELHIVPGSNILLAVSGGVDSMVMMKLFQHSGFTVAVAHCNFQLRGDESEGDEKFVRNFAEKAGVKIHIKKFKTKSFAFQKKISSQMAARQLRYEWFNILLEEFEYAFTATAHHQTDVLETLLINQLRGTGLPGMHGILPVKGKIIRPLLYATRDEIIAYAKQQKLDWREDSSNSSDTYIRNKIRLHILPLLKEINPSVEKTFLENARHFYDAELLLEGILPFVKKEFITQNKNTFYISVERLNKYPHPKALLYFLLRDFSFKNNLVDEISESLFASPGKKFFSVTHQLIKDRQHLIITQRNKLGETESHTYLLQQDDDGLIGDGFNIIAKRKIIAKNHRIKFDNSPAIAYFDADKISFPLQLRKWEKGDYFYPFGMKNKRKKVSDYFVDEKISLDEKQHIWLLLSGNDICWIAGKRSDERFKVTAQTKQVIQLTYHEA